MPVFILFFSFIVASIVGIILSSIFSVNGIQPDWIQPIFLGIIATGVITAAITKENLCSLCSFISSKIKRLQFCKCQHA